MEHTKEYYMRKALNEAQKARDIGEVPVGAVIVKDGKIIARGHNLKEHNQQGYAHAEFITIQKAVKKLKTWNLSDCDLYVTLEPCMMCAGSMYLSRINRLYYGTKDPKGGMIESLVEYKQIPMMKAWPREIEGNILQEECSQILKDFFKERREAKKNTAK